MKMCLLTENVPIVLNENVSIDKKMCLLNENVFIDWKVSYWMKWCLLKVYNHLGINGSSYSFGNFFWTSSFSSFF